MADEHAEPDRPDFQEFFTVIEQDAETHHPRVHYVFADDEELTATIIEPAVDHRIVIVDIDADGKTITKTTSLSPDWQGVRAEVSQAPSWGDSEGKGLMLRLSGADSSTIKLPANATLDDLVAAFDRDLLSLQEIVGLDEPEDRVAA